MAPVARSYLFVPGNRPDRFPKAYASGADAVIVDLEDAVGLDDKRAARQAAAAWLHPNHPVVLRVNGVDTEWFAGDIALGAQPGVTAVMVPKVETAAQVAAVAARLPAGMPILPFIESAAGLDQSADIARAAHVERLVFGSLDFQVDLNLDGDGEETLAFRSHLVLVSRLAGIHAPVDGVWTNIEDTAGLRAHAARGRRLGFGGTLCIHPSQVEPVNACFRPSADQMAWATRVMAAVSLSKGSAVKVDGRMVDVPVIRKAAEILAGSASK